MAWLIKSICHDIREEYEESLQAAQTAYRINPKSRVNQLAVMIFHGKLGNIEKSIEVARAILQKFPDEELVLLHLRSLTDKLDKEEIEELDQKLFILSKTRHSLRQEYGEKLE